MFTRFASGEMSSSGAGEKAIARFDRVETTESSRTLCHIAIASDDRVYALRRSSACKKANDDTRAIFMRAVSDMFDGNIPENVKKAMKLKDYNCGRPLTARRILAVREAILADAAARQIPAAIAAINRDQPKPGLQLTKEQMKEATKLFIDYASVSTGKYSKNNDILAAYIVRLVATPDLPGTLFMYVPGMSVPNCAYREFKPGDPRAQDLDKDAKKYLCKVVKECCQRYTSFNEDDISLSFTTDADHGNYSIAGRSFAKGQSSAAEVVDALKGAVKKPLHRKVLSDFMCRSPKEILSSLAGDSGSVQFSPESTQGPSLVCSFGAEMIVGARLKENGFCDLSGTPSYTLDIAPDGKNAKLTHVLSGKLRFDVATGGNIESDESIGTATFTQEFTFDLSKDEPELTDYHIGQTFGV